MIRIEEHFPGAGAQWYNEGVMERNAWLNENVDAGNVRVWWKDPILTSDVMIVGFVRQEDALAYKLRWFSGYNK
jgi:hypothetical protein